MAYPARLFVLPALVALVGCATTPYRAKVPSTSDMACVADFTDVVRVPLRPLDAKTTEKLAYVEFADVAQCYRNADASIPLALYAIEGVSPPAEIAVSVLLSTGGTFATAVDVLDAEFRSLQRHGFDAFVRRGDEYSMTIFLNPSAPAPAYLMLTPDAAQVGKQDVAIGSMTSSAVMSAGGGMFVYNTGSETRAVREFLAGGRIKVTVKPQANAGFGDR